MSQRFERRVKIVTTLGPATSGRDRLRELILAGADMVRVNAAHGSDEERKVLIEDVREASRELGLRVPILFDLRGLKIRTTSIDHIDAHETVSVARGSKVLVVEGNVPTRDGVIGIDLPGLLNYLQPGSRLLISDGLIELFVESVDANGATCSVGRGGPLHSRQGVTLPGAPIDGGSMTEVDLRDTRFAVEQGVDYLGLSFINGAEDLVKARGIVQYLAQRSAPQLIAKIERPAALENLHELTKSTDAIMVARGDLGVQLPPEQVPRAQKSIIATANELGVPVITATQMLESMIKQPIATRAETNDVANAVWDGTDAVMLSAETAIGEYPIEAVQTMNRIILEVEKDGPVRSQSSIKPLPRSDEAALMFADSIARATFELAESSSTHRIIVFTLTGASARRIAKYRPRNPIIAVTTNEDTATRLNLVWGVRSVMAEMHTDPDTAFRAGAKAAIDAGLANPGDHVLIVGSLPMQARAGRTNLVHVRQI
ncbi:MAG: pyruvate kinase [Thermomicrobiales bacterium]